MLVTKVDPQTSLFESMLPAEFRRVPPGLVAVDKLLDDPVFFEPFVPFFDPALGRPSIPMETYLRLMYLRFKYGLGFEPLCAEVTDSLSWRSFCRIGPYDKVPHPTTLMKITTKCGQVAVDGLNEALLKKADSAKLIKLDKVRSDTTVVPANVCYPTDSSLLAKGVAKLVRTTKALKSLGLATRTTFRDRARSVRSRAHDIGAWLRRRNDDAKSEVLKITGEMASIAEATIADALHVAQNAKRTLASRGEPASKKALALVADLANTCQLLGQVVAQARTRVDDDEVPDGSKRIVSLHDTDARPIRKGRLGKPVEFGYKAQVTDNSDGVVVDLAIYRGNPADGPMLVPAIERVIGRFAKVPRAVAADRGYGEAGVEAAVADLGVKTVAIPRKGKPGKARRDVESARKFRSLVKWRTGCEGRISYLKHSWGFERALFDGEIGVNTWCGWGMLSHNSAKIAGLYELKENKQAERMAKSSSKPVLDNDPPLEEPPAPNHKTA